MTDIDVDRVLSFEPFSRIDPAKFPDSTPLREIVRNDCRVVRFRGDHATGDIIVRQGDYGSSLFFIMSGSARVALDLPDRLLGRREARRRGVLGAIAQLITNHRTPEFRDTRRYGRSATGAATDSERQRRLFLQDIPQVLEDDRAVVMGPGSIFGELAALTRAPRTATVFADTDCELLEMRWQGFRDIRRRADELRQHVDQLYRERSLKAHLQSTPLFEHLTDAELEEVADQTEFETYGEFDWYAGYQRLAQEDPARRLAHEPIIAEQGTYPNGLIMIRSGFARLSAKVGNGERTLSYLGKGQVYGFEEIAHNYRHAASIPLQRSLRAVGYVDVLRVPTVVVEYYLLSRRRDDEVHVHLTQAGTLTRHLNESGGIPSGLTEFLVENRFINGSATMIIDLDRCTRCDDCVRACANAHDGNPRFIRHGPRYDHHMVANACMHCADPVCMIGCPTGAIHRNPLGGEVVINDDTCIGCATCANSCPYHNIRIVEIRDEVGDFITDAHTHLPIMKATKCDLCADQPGGPACQRACPHDALRRADMADLASLAGWLNR
jgi:Fe-S-cluster-containing dehydrogenase component/CRP-like cAMP-binding protein